MLFDEDMSDKVYNWLMKQTPERLIEIMGTAVSDMQSYNGQSIKAVINNACGFETVPDENGETKGWKIPKVQEVLCQSPPLKPNTESQPQSIKLNYKDVPFMVAPFKYSELSGRSMSFRQVKSLKESPNQTVNHSSN